MGNPKKLFFVFCFSTSFFFLISQTTYSADDSKNFWKATLYSENQYLGKSSHAVSDSRARIQYHINDSQFIPYIGGHHTRDWSATPTVSYSENYFAPTIGAIAKIYGPFYAQVEQRFRLDKENIADFRTGIFAYYPYNFSQKLLLENYFESFILYRISSSPITSAYSRLVYLPVSFIGPYSEIFFRETKNVELGTRQRELRLGIKSIASLNQEKSLQLLFFGFQRFTFFQSQEANSLQTQIILQGDF